MDPRAEDEIERALASLAGDKNPTPMPFDVASRFDAHLNSLMAEDAKVVRTDRFAKSWSSRIVKNSSWIAAASILTVVALVGVTEFSGDGKSLVPTISEDGKVTPSQPAEDVAPTSAPAAKPEVVAPTDGSEIPSNTKPQDGGAIYGNGEEIGSDLTQSVPTFNSGSNYSEYLGPIAEKIRLLELPGSNISLSRSNQACIKALGISEMTIGIDSGMYKGSKVTAYWIATGTFERGAVLVASGCKKLTFVKE